MGVSNWALHLTRSGTAMVKELTVGSDKPIRVLVEFHDIAVEDGNNLLEAMIVWERVTELPKSPKKPPNFRICFDESFKSPNAVGSNLRSPWLDISGHKLRTKVGTMASTLPTLRMTTMGAHAHGKNGVPWQSVCTAFP